MKKWIIIGLIVLVGGAILIVPLVNNDAGCEGDAAMFTFDGNLACPINQVIEVKAEVKCDQVTLLEVICNDEVIESWKDPKGTVSFKFDGSVHGLGAKSFNLRATLSDGTSMVDRRLLRVLSDIEPEEYEAVVKSTFPHIATSFTQGLEFYKGKLYEGTGDPGQRGSTVVAEVDLTSGKHVQSVGLDATYFGEGITILNDELFQLTWQNGKCFVYDVNSLSDNLIKREFTYKTEGWGLCNDGKSIIMSDGSERLTFRNPTTFEIERTIEVYDNLGPMPRLNELEYMDGLIYANVWTLNFVVAIDPKTGKVVKKIDATELVKVGRGNGEVLNGIAANDGKIYMTGKNWNALYEVQFVKK